MSPAPEFGIWNPELFPASWRLGVSLCVLCVLCGVSAFSARAGEHLFVSGGPALRTFERHKNSSHDVFWGNFIQGALCRYPEIQDQIGPDDTFTWMFFRPGYENRGREMGADLIAEIQTRIAPTGARIVWFHSAQEFIDYVNSGNDRPRNKIERLEFFGHSNRKAWMFDYSNRLDAALAVTDLLHIKDLDLLNRSAFAPNAYTRSWGCHSGEEFSAYWKKYTGVPMVGAIGKTDYSGGALPVLSTAEGRWTD